MQRAQVNRPEARGRTKQTGIPRPARPSNVGVAWEPPCWVMRSDERSKPLAEADPSRQGPASAQSGTDVRRARRGCPVGVERLTPKEVTMPDLNVLPNLIVSLPGFTLYALCSVVLILKMYVLGAYTATVRGRNKVTLNKEDA